MCVFGLALLVCAGVTKRHPTSWNDISRWATVDALVSDRTFAIDGSPFAAATGDKIRARGRTFSDKPPLLALSGAGVAEVALDPDLGAIAVRAEDLDREVGRLEGRLGCVPLRQ